MKKGDIITIIAVLAVIGAFAFVPGAMDGFNKMTAEHGMIMSFFKFAILGTFGEMLALRIRKGSYLEKGFGVAQAGEWFAQGAPLTLGKAFVALCVSVLMNTIFAPVFMTFHKVTDIHIAETGGTLKGFFCNKLKIQETIAHKINWDLQYGFVFKKTIPLFWYPAHTITFLLVDNYQVLFAAFLGVVLGVMLSIKK